MNEQVADWIEVDESKYNQIKQAYSGVDSRSVLIEMSMSPYDVPLQVRGDYDECSKRFVIDFRYIDSEDSKSLQLDDHMSAVVGLSSGRIYSLLIDLEALGANSVEVKIVEEKVHKNADNALTRMANPVGSPRSKEKSNAKNYTVAQRIISDYWPKLKRELLGAH
ncbi:hypothetical protein [Stenotrophomonas sp.]|uniref:hypothetical protein n=1 Tax=Stenotrophomonas sp. TaxID=69392 RepID=UPI0028AD8332|nr:hypothetical protein [Stenotrophomonas sp.]